MAIKLAVQSIFTALDRVTGPLAGMGRNVDRFSRSAERSGMNIGQAWGRLRGIIGGVAAAVTTGLAVKAIVAFAEKGDEVGRMSRTLGLSAQSFQELGIAAKMADLSSEDLSAAFKKMNNNLGQLRTGTGSLYTYLKATNPQMALQLKHTRNSEEAFTLLMNAIDKEGNVAKRAALSQASFGKSGQAVIEMSHGLEDARRKARESGGIISDADSKAAEGLDTAIKVLKVSLTGLANVIMGHVVRVLGPLLEKFNAWYAINKDIVGQKIEDTIEWIARTAQKAYDIWQKWYPVIVAVGIAIVLMNNALKIAAIISVVSEAITIAAAMMDMFAAGASLATVAQWALNVALDANPIGAVIIALAALIAIVLVMRKYWTEITAALQSGWNWFNKLFGNPWIRTALYMVAAPFAIIAGFIQTIVDLLQGKGWQSLLNMGGPLKAITDAIGVTKAGGQWVSPNSGVISSNTSTSRNVNLDVGFGNVPPGTSIKQTGSAPEITVQAFNTLRGM